MNRNVKKDTEVCGLFDANCHDCLHALSRISLSSLVIIKDSCPNMGLFCIKKPGNSGVFILLHNIFQMYLVIYLQQTLGHDPQFHVFPP